VGSLPMSAINLRGAVTGSRAFTFVQHLALAFLLHLLGDSHRDIPLTFSSIRLLTLPLPNYS
jgi:hypothetical protein